MEDSAGFDNFVELCSDQHRRIVLAILDSQQRPLTVQDLTKTILKYNHHQSPAEVSGEEHEGIQLSLHHHHIPKLEAEGFVEYDSPRHRVQPTEKLDEWSSSLSAIIEADPTLEPPIGL